MNLFSDRSSHLTPFVFAAALLAFGFGLSGYAANGTFMRYSGDDYCYSAVLAEHGFWQTQTFAYLYVTTYAGNRFSVNLVTAIGSMVGPLANAVLPGLVLILWIGGMTLFLIEHFRSVHESLHLFEGLLAAGTVAFFVLQTTPNLGQSFYWSAGLLTYLLPMTVNTYLAARVLNRIQSSAHLRLDGILILVFSFMSAGFSETVAALQTGIYALVLLAVWIYKRSQTSRNVDKKLPSRAVWLTSAALLGTLIAMAVLALSPANYLRQMSLPHPPGLLALVRMSFYNAYVFTHVAISKQIWQLALCGLFFLGLGCLSAMGQPPKSPRVAHYLIRILACVAASYLLVVCTMAPSVYAETSYPDQRVLIVSWWIVMIETGSLGWLTGQILSRWLQARAYHAPINAKSLTMAVSLTACLAVLAISAFPVAASRTLYAQLPRFQRWAAFWDARDAQLWQASHANVARVEVIQIDHIIQDVSELSPEPTFWYNVCAARYYGVKQIVADLPGWDQ